MCGCQSEKEKTLVGGMGLEAPTKLLRAPGCPLVAPTLKTTALWGSLAAHILRSNRNSCLLQSNCIRYRLKPYQDQKVAQTISDPLSWLGLKCTYCVLTDKSDSKPTKRCICKSARIDTAMQVKRKRKSTIQ